jgi:uncharacterized membrane protein
MANLIAITYPDPGTAAKAMERVDWAEFDKQVKVLDACWMSTKDGSVSVHPAGHPVALMASVGGTLGLLVGTLFALPVVGLAAGAAYGAHREKKRERVFDEPFVESIKEQIAAGGSALVVLYEDGADTERAGADLLEFGGTVHSTTIPADRLAEIQARLDLAANDSSSLE